MALDLLWCGVTRNSWGKNGVPRDLDGKNGVPAEQVRIPVVYSMLYLRRYISTTEKHWDRQLLCWQTGAGAQILLGSAKQPRDYPPLPITLSLCLYLSFILPTGYPSSLTIVLSLHLSLIPLSVVQLSTEGTSYSSKACQSLALPTRHS